MLGIFLKFEQFGHDRLAGLGADPIGAEASSGCVVWLCNPGGAPYLCEIQTCCRPHLSSRTQLSVMGRLNKLQLTGGGRGMNMPLRLHRKHTDLILLLSAASACEDDSWSFEAPEPY